MSTTAEPPAPVAVEAPPAPSLFDSIDWKNPVVGVTKIATHLQSLTSLTPSERLTMLQGSLTFVINTSTMSDEEKSAALLFVKTMVPHLVETAMSALAAEAAVAAAGSPSTSSMEEVEGGGGGGLAVARDYLYI